jgi:hypothetical protein
MCSQKSQSVTNHLPLQWLQLLAVVLIVCHVFSESALAQRRTATRGVKAVNDDMTPTAGVKDVGEEWVRVNYDSKGEPLGMQTAIVRYTAKPDGKNGARPATVDLIGAVHIGDVAYYRQLNDRFKQYDALLYELVAPEGTVVPRGRGTSSTHAVGAIQNMAKDVLELDHQLELVDYTKPNFVHADMSPDEFQQAMKDRNEGFLQMYFKLMGAAMAQQSKVAAKGGGASDFDLIAALFATDRSRRLKIILAKQLADMESLMISFGGEDGNAIINDRNQKALKVLKSQMAAGKKRIGIFYGAGHLNDMDKHLREDFHMQPTSMTWLTAWNLAAKP